ncbi:MAG: hypothetical protein LC623_00220 [Halobacteriales archaeon]|nr:hypothetical protein [Halobacteriales archaeon]
MLDDNGNRIDANHDALTNIGFTGSWTWGQAAGCGYSQIGPSHTWGFADGHSGKSYLFGSGSYGFGFATTYAGGGRDLTRQCQGLQCEWIGYEILSSNARSFMVKPDQGGPVFEGINRVSIPASSGVPPSQWASVALSALSAVLPGWGSVFADVLGFTVPGTVDENYGNYAEIGSSPTGKSGGGILIRGAVAGQKEVVSGYDSWWFGKSGVFTWTMESSVDNHAMFHACVGCTWTEQSTTWYTSAQHQAKVLVPE